MCKKIIEYLKEKRKDYLIEYLKEKRKDYLLVMERTEVISDYYYTALEIKVVLLTEILEELKELQCRDQNNIIIA